MNVILFQQLLEKLSQADWQALVDRQGIQIKDDLELSIGTPDEKDDVLYGTDYTNLDASGLKREVLENADTILSNYYLTNPLSLKGFNHQVRKLLEKYGAEAFSAPFGSIPARTLFVEGGEVVAESDESPRHRYGVFYEVEKRTLGISLEDAFLNWLISGEAHQLYLSMNVCRYSC